MDLQFQRTSPALNETSDLKMVMNEMILFEVIVGAE